jgi:uncharacterized protein YjbI with pentapeptide repeats
MGPDEPVVEPARAVEAGEAEPGLPPGHIADAQPAAGAESALDQKVAGRAHDLEADGPPAAAAGGQRPELELELERLLMTDFGEGATAAEFDAVAAQALALMGAKDSHGRAFDDSDFMQHKDYQRSHLELGEAQALTGAIAAGLLNRLTQGYDESRFRRWACGSRVGVHRLRAAPSGTAAGDDDAGEEAVAGAGSRAAAAGRAPATRVVLVSVLLAHATSREAPELEAMLEQLHFARLEGVVLRKAQLPKARLDRVNLAGAVAADANFAGAKLQCATVGGEPGKEGWWDGRATVLRRVCAIAICNPQPAALQPIICDANEVVGRRFQTDFTGADCTMAQFKYVDLSYATLTGAIFDAVDLSGALMFGATFDIYTVPAKKVVVAQGGQLGGSVAKAVGKGLWAEMYGADMEEDEQGGVEEQEGSAIVDEGANLIDGEDLAYVLDQVAHAVGV